MAKKLIAGNVKIGGIYECDFGLFKDNNQCQKLTTTDSSEADISDLNYKIPHELIKKRPVVVVSKHRGLCLVVPISTTQELHKKKVKIPENQGIHVKIPHSDFPQGAFKYAHNVDMWAKCNLITHVDVGRLRDLRSSNNTSAHLPVFTVSNELLKKIRHGIILSIGMKELLEAAQESSTEAETGQDVVLAEEDLPTEARDTEIEGGKSLV